MKYSVIVFVVLGLSITSCGVTPLETIDYSVQLTNKSANEIYVMTLNLHTYQESDQNVKLQKIASIIADLDIDIITFQECAQNKNAPIVDTIDGVSIKNDNMAKVIVDIIQSNYNVSYHYTWDWAHYGWTQWEEGMAVLSKYPIDQVESRWLSDSTSSTYTHSRKGVYGRIQYPGFGNFNVISAHTSWESAGGVTHISNARAMSYEKYTNDNSAVLNILAGDFNSQPTDTPPTGYNTLVEGGLLRDTLLEYFPAANNLPENPIYNTIGGTYPGRIDYITIMSNDNFTVRYCEIVFTVDNLGTVSDHNGVITVLRKNN